MLKPYLLTGLMMLLMLGFLSAASARDLDIALQEALESLSMAYNQQYPITESKKGLAILSFRENTESARKNGLGEIELAIEKRPPGELAGFG